MKTWRPASFSNAVSVSRPDLIRAARPHVIRELRIICQNLINCDQIPLRSGPLLPLALHPGQDVLQPYHHHGLGIRIWLPAVLSCLRSGLGVSGDIVSGGFAAPIR